MAAEGEESSLGADTHSHCRDYCTKRTDPFHSQRLLALGHVPFPNIPGVTGISKWRLIRGQPGIERHF